jgi:hypothetical protein
MNRLKCFSISVGLAALSAVTCAAPLDEFPRTTGGQPDFSGVWQSLNTAHWNLEPHTAQDGGVPQLAAQFAVPPGQGVVVGGRIPYREDALVQRNNNYTKRLDEDPEAKCYLGGVPRSTYMPYPFQIVQDDETLAIIYQFATGLRRLTINGTEEAPLDSWMGWSNARWDGDTLVVEVTGLNGQTWLDRAGNYASAAAKVTERYTPLSPNHIQYEATIDDPSVFTEAWTIRMPLYRIVDDDYRLLEFKCEPFAEEKLYGHLRKPAQ